MIDINVARDKLAQFETPDEIADFLISEGVQGIPSLAESCAIAVWMQKTTSKTIGVSRSAMWDTTVSTNNPNVKFLQHTDAMTEFTAKFDRGEYRELLRVGVSTWK